MSSLTPATYTVIKPYAFPALIPAIDPQLSSSPPTCGTRTRFTEEELDQLIRIAADEDPWKRPHGQVGPAWRRILACLQEQKKFEGSSITTLQNKVNAFIAWQKVWFGYVIVPCTY